MYSNRDTLRISETSFILSRNSQLSRSVWCVQRKMDPHFQFCTIINNWIGTVAFLGGHDLYRETKRTNVYTVVTITIALSFPIIYFWTIYNYDGDLRFCAIANYGAGIQVNERSF